MSAPRYFNLAKNLKKLLFEKNMKPIDLARELEIPQPTVHRLVSGKSTRPYKSSLEPIAKFFSISVDELIGEEPSETIWPLEQSSIIKKIPIIQWNELKSEKTLYKNEKNFVLSIGNLSEYAFATLMEDSSMEPLFPKGTLLILDPDKNPKDRNYVIAALDETRTFIFRQLLTDADDQYLKPLNPDSNIFKTRLIQKKDNVIGVLVESRNRYVSNDQTLLKEE
jgi:SOS-response transcriptional repressor LexA